MVTVRKPVQRQPADRRAVRPGCEHEAVAADPAAVDADAPRPRRGGLGGAVDLDRRGDRRQRASVVVIVAGPSDGIANAIVPPPPRSFAALIASRSVQSAALQTPSSWSALVLTTIGSGERDRVDRGVVAAERRAVVRGLDPRDVQLLAARARRVGERVDPRADVERRGQRVDVVRPRSRRSATRSACRRPGSWRRRPAASGARCRPGTSNEKPLPRVETSTPSGAGGGPPLCWSPAGTPLAEPVGAPPVQLNAYGPANWPIPRSGAVGAGSMLVSALIALPPHLANVGGQRRARASAGVAPDRPVDRPGARQVDRRAPDRGRRCPRAMPPSAAGTSASAPSTASTQSRLRLTTPPQ